MMLRLLLVIVVAAMPSSLASSDQADENCLDNNIKINNYDYTIHVHTPQHTPVARVMFNQQAKKQIYKKVYMTEYNVFYAIDDERSPERQFEMAPNVISINDKGNLIFLFGNSSNPSVTPYEDHSNYVYAMSQDLVFIIKKEVDKYYGKLYVTDVHDFNREFSASQHMERFGDEVYDVAVDTSNGDVLIGSKDKITHLVRRLPDACRVNHCGAGDKRMEAIMKYLGDIEHNILNIYKNFNFSTQSSSCTVDQFVLTSYMQLTEKVRNIIDDNKATWKYTSFKSNKQHKRSVDNKVIVGTENRQEEDFYCIEEDKFNIHVDGMKKVTEDCEKFKKSLELEQKKIPQATSGLNLDECLRNLT